MTTSQLNDRIQQLVETCQTQITLLARARMDACGLTPEKIYDAIKFGDYQVCREDDRLKYILEDVIVFVAVGKNKHTGGDKAFIVAAYMLRNFNNSDIRYK